MVSVQSTSKRVLIVADDPKRGDMLSRIATTDGHRCTLCPQTAGAYTRIRRERFDLVVSDVGGASADGNELLELTAGLHDRPRIVVLASDRSDEAVRRGFKAGAYDVLPKTVSHDEIRRILRSALNDAPTGAITASAGPPIPSHADGEREDLTGFVTRRAFAESLAVMRCRCRDGNTHASIVVIDIAEDDRPQQILMHTVARALRRMCTESDPVARLSPHRLIIALENTSEAEGGAFVGRLRIEVNTRSQTRPIHMNVGLAGAQRSFVETEDDIVERAMLALARATETGNDQTVSWSQASRGGPTQRQLEFATMDNLSRWIRHTQQEMRRGYLESTLALVAAVEAKDPFTHRHARTVSRYSEEIARRLNLSAPQVETIKTAALLHDIGKIGVPDTILQKAGPLTHDEFELIKKHPQTGVDILRHTSFLSAELPIILHHHERFDGTGYPDGLAGEDIPIGARVVSVADALDTILSPRSYKPAMSIDCVVSELTSGEGRQFDPTVARVATAWLDAHPQALLRH